MTQRRTNRRCRKWTPEEDATLMRYMKAYPTNCHHCFLTVAEQIGRTEAAVANHWYQKLSKSTEAEVAFGFISSKGFAKNRKNGEGEPHSESIFRRVLRILGF